jgi:hypothetical protein
MVKMQAPQSWEAPVLLHTLANVRAPSSTARVMSRSLTTRQWQTIIETPWTLGTSRLSQSSVHVGGRPPNHYACDSVNSAIISIRARQRTRGTVRRPSGPAAAMSMRSADFRVTPVRRALDPRGRYILIGHDAFGATGHRWLGSI